MVEVTVLIGIETNELQKDIAGALCLLIMLMMTETEVHVLALLTLSSFSGLGAPRTKPQNAIKENPVKCFMTCIVGLVRSGNC